EVLPARVHDYSAANLDTLMASGEVVWIGKEAVGDRDGRIALYLAESMGKLLPPPAAELPEFSERARKILDFLQSQGASFFAALHAAAGAGFPNETQEALWELVWAGQITNDTFHPVRQLLQSREEQRTRGTSRDGPPGSPEFLRRVRARTGQA